MVSRQTSILIILLLVGGSLLFFAGTLLRLQDPGLEIDSVRQRNLAVISIGALLVVISYVIQFYLIISKKEKGEELIL